MERSLWNQKGTDLKKKNQKVELEKILKIVGKDDLIIKNLIENTSNNGNNNNEKKEQEQGKGEEKEKETKTEKENDNKEYNEKFQKLLINIQQMLDKIFKLSIDYDNHFILDEDVELLDIYTTFNEFDPYFKDEIHNWENLFSIFDLNNNYLNQIGNDIIEYDQILSKFESIFKLINENPILNFEENKELLELNKENAIVKSIELKLDEWKKKLQDWLQKQDDLNAKRKLEKARLKELKKAEKAQKKRERKLAKAEKKRKKN